MSNQQWNSGQGANEWAPQPQGSSNEFGAQQGGQDWNQQGAQEWGQQAQQQPSAQEWGQPQPQGSAQDWGQQAQQQPSAQEWGQQPQQQPSAQDWGQQQQGQQDWNQPQQQQSAQDWGQQQGQVAAGNDWQAQGGAAQQDWNQQQGGQDWNQQQGGQDWNQQQNWQGQGQGQQGYFPANQQGFAGGPAEPKGNPFDFGFKKLSLPGAAGMIFMIGVIAIGVEWLFSFIALLGSGNEFVNVSALAMLNSIVGGLAGALFKVLVLRVLIEIGFAAAKLLDKSDKNEETPSA